MWTYSAELLGMRTFLVAGLLIVLHFIFPSTAGWCHLTPWHKASSHPSRTHIQQHTDVKCHRVRGKTHRIWNFKMKRENWERRGGEEDNEKKGGVKSHSCSPRPDSAGLQPCSTLIHHYRFTISFSSLLPPTQMRTTTGMRSPTLNATHNSFDLKPSDQMNLYGLEYIHDKRWEYCCGYTDEHELQIFPHQHADNSGRFTWKSPVRVICKQHISVLNAKVHITSEPTQQGYTQYTAVFSPLWCTWFPFKRSPISQNRNTL